MSASNQNERIVRMNSNLHRPYFSYTYWHPTHKSIHTEDTEVHGVIGWWHK